MGRMSRIRKHPQAVSAMSQILMWTVSTIVAIAAFTALAISIHNIIVEAQRHDDRNKHTKSVGFSAFKNSTQATTDDVAVDVTDWVIGDAYPSYDNTKGGFNATSGVFTVKKEGIYTAIATVCFTGSTTGTREVQLVTSGAVELVAVSSVIGTNGSEQCITVSQHQWLVEDAEVNVMAFTDSGTAEDVIAGTLFSVERVAKFSA